MDEGILNGEEVAVGSGSEARNAMPCMIWCNDEDRLNVKYRVAKQEENVLVL